MLVPQRSINYSTKNHIDEPSIMSLELTIQDLKKSTYLQNIQIATRGEVKQVKILGTVAMIDEGETDWKLFCIDVNDPLAKDMNGKDEQ